MALLKGPGPLPAAYGKMSTFGGIDDTYKNERMSNLSYAALYKFKQKFGQGSGSVTAYLNSVLNNQPLWYRAMFANTNRVNAIGADYPKFGLFAYLNESALYCAGRWDNTKYKKLHDANNPWITFTNPETGKKVTCLRLDLGPLESTGREYDLSPGSAQFIGAKTDTFVSARYATADEIKKAKAYQLDLWKNGATKTKAFKELMKGTSSNSNQSNSSYSLIPILLLIAGGAYLISKKK